MAVLTVIGSRIVIVHLPMELELRYKRCYAGRSIISAELLW